MFRTAFSLTVIVLVAAGSRSLVRAQDPRQPLSGQLLTAQPAAPDQPLANQPAAAPAAGQPLQNQAPQNQSPGNPPPGNTPVNPQPLPPAQATLPDKCPSLEDLGYRFKSLAQISLNIGITEGDQPQDCSANLFQSQMVNAPARPPINMTVFWAASELWHQPLYFEDPVLERYGRTYHPLIQPALSFAHFFGTLPIIPYKIGLDRTHDRIYTLGYFRPGSHVPNIGYKLPFEKDAVVMQGGTLTAAILLLP